MRVTAQEECSHLAGSLSLEAVSFIKALNFKDALEKLSMAKKFYQETKDRYQNSTDHRRDEKLIILQQNLENIEPLVKLLEDVTTNQSNLADKTRDIVKEHCFSTATSYYGALTKLGTSVLRLADHLSQFTDSLDGLYGYGQEFLNRAKSPKMQQESLCAEPLRGITLTRANTNGNLLGGLQRLLAIQNSPNTIRAEELEKSLLG